MTVALELPADPRQLLPRQAYTSDDWLQRERRHLFGRTWAFAGVIGDFEETGDYRTVAAGAHTLVVMRDGEGELKGYHNLCRHRGTELLEGCGNAGRTIMCPYHNWVYDLDGSLRGVPAQTQCFPNLDKGAIRLRSAAIGIFRDLVFVHPEAEPAEPFEVWIDDLGAVPWPHDLGSVDLEEASDDIVYEIKCNWKVFFENAVDGYHLAYLHKETLGGPLPHLNTWEAKGRHLVWWSTERDGIKSRIPLAVEKAAENAWTKTVKGAEAQHGYGGVYMLFPTTILLPNPWGFSIATMAPVDAGTTLLRQRNWTPKGFMSDRYSAADIPGFDAASGRIKSSHSKTHPLETGDFMTEDIWVCEKMQRALHSPNHEVTALAKGAGGEAGLEFFQRCVLDFIESGETHVAA